MASDIEFRSYRPEDKETILKLLATGRHPNYAREKSIVFDWQFFANPATDGVPFLIGTVGDEIVATNGFMPVKIRFRGKAERGCWSLDTYVSGNYRGRGFGKALIERVSAHAPVMLGFGISDMSDPILDKNGWQLDPSMSTLFFHANQPGLKGLGTNLLSRGARWVRGRKADRSADLKVEDAVPSAELDALWSRVEGQYENAVQRDGAYLIWRYRDSPKHRYRWLTARRGGELAGLLVTRHHPVESVVVDYLGPLEDPELLAGLFGAAISDLAAAGTQRVRCETNHPAIKAALAAVGFLTSRSPPGRFRARSNVLPPSASPSGWFVLTGDSDNDLLTF